MKTLRNEQVRFILKAELSHLVLIKMSSSTEMNDIFDKYNTSVLIKVHLFIWVASCGQTC